MRIEFQLKKHIKAVSLNFIVVNYHTTRLHVGKQALYSYRRYLLMHIYLLLEIVNLRFD